MKTYIKRLNAKASQIKAGRVPFCGAALIVCAFVLITLISRESVPDFSEYEVGDERKEAFFSYLLPLIEERNEELMAIREELQGLSDDRTQLSFLERRKIADLADTYEIAEFSLDDPAQWNELLRRVDVVPPSLALAQAASESAWGTSRFALEGNNFFGHWCFAEECGVVPSARDEGANHEVKGFDSVKESVEGYMHNLNYHPAYAELRSIRTGMREREEPLTGLKLAAGLGSYSERGDVYIEELRSIIQFNDLSQYDASINGD